MFCFSPMCHDFIFDIALVTMSQGLFKRLWLCCCINTADTQKLLHCLCQEVCCHGDFLKREVTVYCPQRCLSQTDSTTLSPTWKVTQTTRFYDQHRVSVEGQFSFCWLRRNSDMLINTLLFCICAKQILELKKYHSRETNKSWGCVYSYAWSIS